MTHGSVAAASCLLRMGADPGARPEAPPAFLRAPSPWGAEGDRNYGKCRDASAWKPAFGFRHRLRGGRRGRKAPRGGGGSAGGDGSDSAVFGRRRRTGRRTAPPTRPPGKMRAGRKPPLDIHLSKPEGIGPAFTAEAPRAIGSDEADAEAVRVLLVRRLDVVPRVLVEDAVAREERGAVVGDDAARGQVSREARDAPEL